MTKDDLQVLMVLSDNRRLPQMEADIFESRELTRTYMSALALGRHWKLVVDTDALAAYAVFEYARMVMQERWPAAEPCLARSEFWRRRYESYFEVGDTNDM